MDDPSTLKVRFEKDLTPVVTSILNVFLKPYNDLLAKMAEDGRLTREEMDQLRQQTREQGKRLGELVEDDMASDEPRV